MEFIQLCDTYGYDLKQKFERGDFKLSEVLCVPKSLYNFDRSIISLEGEITMTIRNSSDIVGVSKSYLKLHSTDEIIKYEKTQEGNYKLLIKYEGPINMKLSSLNVIPINPPSFSNTFGIWNIPLPFTCFENGIEKYNIMKEYKVAQYSPPVMLYDYAIINRYDFKIPKSLTRLYGSVEEMKAEFEFMLYAIGAKDLDTKSDLWTKAKKDPILYEYHSLYTSFEGHGTKYLLIDKSHAEMPNQQTTKNTLSIISEKLDKIIELLTSIERESRSVSVVPQ